MLRKHGNAGQGFVQNKFESSPRQEQAEICRFFHEWENGI